MSLTPLDIHNKEFHTKLRGYDQDEVNDFLDQIIKDYELVLKESAHLTESLKQSQEKLKYFNDLKDSLNQSIIVAQEAADKVKANSQREAEIINREAQKQGQDIIDQANEKHVILSMKLPRNQNVWLWRPTICASKPVSSAKSFKLCWNPSLKLLKVVNGTIFCNKVKQRAMEAIQEAIRHDDTP